MTKEVQISSMLQKFKKSFFYIALALTTSTTTVYGATLSPNCVVNTISSTQVEIIGPTLGVTTLTPAVIGNNASTGITLGNGTFQCISLTAPSDLTMPPCAPPTSTVLIPDGSPIYVSQYDLTNDTYCAYEATATPTAVSAMAFAPSMNPVSPSPTSVPIFSPFGILAMMGGLLWFGRNRSIKLKK